MAVSAGVCVCFRVDVVIRLKDDKRKFVQIEFDKYLSRQRVNQKILLTVCPPL